MTRPLLSLALVVAAIALGSVVPTPRTAPDLPAQSGAPSSPSSWDNGPREATADVGRAGVTPAAMYGVPTPTGSVGSALLGGWATFYEDPAQRIDHYAAAGKLLRDTLGDWRGKVIRVQSGQHSTIVALRDSCACGERHGLPTIIDLSPEAFRDLAPLSAGVIRVTVELVVLPSTDALPRNEADLRMMREVREDDVYR